LNRAPLPPRPALLVEIAGVTGSGKSTLAQTLCERRENCRLYGSLRMREPSHIPYVVHSVPSLVPLLAGCVKARRMPTWTELKLLIYVMEWSRRLDRQTEYRTGLTLIDQGPVYALARLGQADPPLAGTQPHGTWWMSTMDMWRNSLDAVIWLDAPNEVLWQRVNTRTQSHGIKNQSAALAMSFIERYRQAYETVFRSMEREGGPTVLRYDTSRQIPEEIASDALNQLAGRHLQRRPPGSGKST
jgi:thymidylate kinase